MSRLYHFSYCLLFYVGLYLLPAHAADSCVRKTACSCEFSNGTGIDLTESAKSSFYTAQDFRTENDTKKLYFFTYYFHPCSDATVSVGSLCDSVGICRQTIWEMTEVNNTYTRNATVSYENFGTSAKTTFSPDGRFIIYDHSPSHNYVELICADMDDKIYVISSAEPNNVTLQFFSRNVCLKQLEAVGRSTGSTLLIIFFSCVIFYLVLGVCTKKFLMGATGIEVVPNLAFWSELPNLVKDGWAFAVNGFKLPARAGPAASPDPNSYDSI